MNASSTCPNIYTLVSPANAFFADTCNLVLHVKKTNGRMEKGAKKQSGITLDYLDVLMRKAKHASLCFCASQLFRIGLRSFVATRQNLSSVALT